MSSLRFASLAAIVGSWIVACGGSTAHNTPACNEGDVQSPASCAAATCGGDLQSAVCHAGAFVCPTAATSCDDAGTADTGAPPHDSGPPPGTVTCGTTTCNATNQQYCRGETATTDAGAKGTVTYACFTMATLCTPPQGRATCACVRQLQGCDSVGSTEVSCDDSQGDVVLVCVN